MLGSFYRGPELFPFLVVLNITFLGISAQKPFASGSRAPGSRHSSDGRSDVHKTRLPLGGALRLHDQLSGQESVLFGVVCSFARNESSVDYLGLRCGFFLAYVATVEHFLLCGRVGEHFCYFFEHVRFLPVHLVPFGYLCAGREHL